MRICYIIGIFLAVFVTSSLTKNLAPSTPIIIAAPQKITSDVKGPYGSCNECQGGGGFACPDGSGCCSNSYPPDCNDTKTHYCETTCPPWKGTYVPMYHFDNVYFESVLEIEVLVSVREADSSATISIDVYAHQLANIKNGKASLAITLILKVEVQLTEDVDVKIKVKVKAESEVEYVPYGGTQEKLISSANNDRLIN